MGDAKRRIGEERSAGGARAGALSRSQRFVSDPSVGGFVLSRVIETRHRGADAHERGAGRADGEWDDAISGHPVMSLQQAMPERRCAMPAAFISAKVTWAQGRADAAMPRQRTLTCARTATGKSDCPIRSRDSSASISRWEDRRMVVSILPHPLRDGNSTRPRRPRALL